MTKVGKYRNLTSLNYKGIIILYTLVLVSFIIFSAQIVRAEVLARETFDNPSFNPEKIPVAFFSRDSVFSYARNKPSGDMLCRDH